MRRLGHLQQTDHQREQRLWIVGLIFDWSVRTFESAVQCHKGFQVLSLSISLYIMLIWLQILIPLELLYINLSFEYKFTMGYQVCY
jgi:hypothetical protein